MGRTAFNCALLPGSTLSIGGKEVEVDCIMPKKDYISWKASLTTSLIESTPVVQNPLLSKLKPNLVSKSTKVAEKEEIKKPRNATAPKSLASQVGWKNPMLANTELPKKITESPKVRNSPKQPGAIVMKRPGRAPEGKEIVDVVIDPFLAKHLREHQKEGVKFLYECVMGMRDFDGQGAILADEMGLGKTLQTIALLWTLLKQNPIYGDDPVIKKALIVCPVTLINNWRKEFRKWLGNERIGVFVADGTKTRLTDFTMGKSYSIMIIGYEKLRTVQEELKKGSGIDIVIADEGHRLKTAQNKSALAIKSLKTPRRIILSGTPIQNDLSEFFMMVDFVNPGLLDTIKRFTKDFEGPIMKGRQPGAIQKDVDKGTEKAEELASLTNIFILRRSADILSKYLPQKTEYILFCRPTSAQASLYQHVLASPVFQSALGNPESHLLLITILKKVCNSPKLLDAGTSANIGKPISPMTASLLSDIPPQLLRTNAGSTKIRVLDQLLHTIRSTTSEKVVLVSNFTSTLDLLSTLLASLALPSVRLDGSTPAAKRQDIVDNFNRTPASTCFAFLLSAKAGGMGLNLIGASRLILFDVDWNPSVDLQAMARIHRDGQKRPVFIYRFLMAGGLDEKIWQRQVTKLGLASSVMESKGGKSSFTKEELKDLFRLDESLACQTHELIGCDCGGRGVPDAFAVDEIIGGDDDGDEEEFPDFPELVKASQINVVEQERKIQEGIQKAKKRDGAGKMQALMSYSHVNTSRFATEQDEDMEALIQDDVLLDVLRDEGNRVSFIFAKTSG